MYSTVLTVERLQIPPNFVAIDRTLPRFSCLALHMKHLAYLNKFFWKYRWRLLLGILFVGLANWFRVWQPKVIGNALDTVVERVGFYEEHGGITAHPEASGELGMQIAWFGAAVIGLALLMGLFMFFMRQTIIVVSRLIEYDMRKEIFAHYEKLDLAFYKRNSTGDLMSRISEDVSKVRMFLGPTILYGLDLIFLFILTISSMLHVSLELTLWSLLPLPFLSISIYWVSTLINRRSEKIQQQLAVLTSTAQEVYSGIRVVKSYVQEKAMGRWFADQSEEFRLKSLKLIRIDAFFFPLMALMIGISTIITVYVGGLLVVETAGLPPGDPSKVTAGNIAEFVIYINMLTWPVTAIGWIASLTQQAAASQKRINEFLQKQPAITNPVDDSRSTVDGKTAPGVAEPSTVHRLPSTVLQGHIRFEDVSFVYPDTGIQALDHVSFEILPGQKLAIIGRTGSGKTTMADLLVRMYDVTEGRILVDGKDIREHDLYHLRRSVGYVPQDVFLFSDTVYGNIAFGKEGLTREEAAFYAKSAAVHNDIEDLPEGYDTLVGERGVTLSGGQKQRVSIARAFAKQPDIILLDDCLSAVDTNTESQILGYLDDALAHKTAIIITHRIYSMLQFDKIIVLDNHRIAEEGTHEELLARGGYYAELFEKQSAGELPE
ncbi:MAG: putative multidrug resistance ABC transporter ATP-binding/permease protein YheI [Saprospiraceae bacterium]|nr:putative multidrug resistance ABC transporter ATP-binding/permease protein YheI [Saprospiraceae bacterium]